MKVNKLTPKFNLRWESSRIMLPEHKEQIISHHLDKGKIIKPIIDEARLEEFDEAIQTALEFHNPVTVTYWSNGFKEVIEGFVHYVDLINMQIRIKDFKEVLYKINFDSIINIQ